MDRPINRIKVMLAEKHKSNKWLAEALGVVMKWKQQTELCFSAIPVFHFGFC